MTAPRRRASLLALALALALRPRRATSAAAHAAPPATRDVLVVGNNWDGTADVVDPHALEGPHAAEHRPRPRPAPRRDRRRSRRARLLQRQQPARRRGPRPVRRRRLHLARRAPSLRLAAEPGRRRRVRPRHAADRLAGEGRRLPLRPHGALAGRHAAARLGLDRRQGPRHRHARGAIVAEFPLRRPAAREQLLARRHADLPREHRQRLHAAGHAALDATKGKRVFQIVDARTYEVLKRIDVGQALADNGYPGMSAAVRPMVLSPDERFAYLQLSFLHGFVEFDLESGKPVRIAHLPLSASAEDAAARVLPAGLRPPRHRDEPRRDEALRRRHDVRLRGDRARATTSRTRSSTPAASRTGRRTPPTAACASCRPAATTR